MPLIVYSSQHTVVSQRAEKVVFALQRKTRNLGNPGKIFGTGGRTLLNCYSEDFAPRPSPTVRPAGKPLTKVSQWCADMVHCFVVCAMVLNMALAKSWLLTL
jgi:hypothetical protein